MVVAVHTGTWGDFRQMDIKLAMDWVIRHPETRFDLYHMGMPNVREAGFVGRNFPNVWLNLTWSHLLSPEMTRSALREWLDLIPCNKILGFGGDHGFSSMEKVVGHLHMAREDFAGVFGRRIDRGLMSFEEAVHVLRLWFWDNALGLYTRLTA